MKSAVIRESLYMCAPFMLALAASEIHFSYSQRDSSYIILVSYNMVFLVFGYFEKLCSLLRTAEHFPSKIAYGLIIFFVIALIRDILYGAVDKENNLPIIRCFIMLTFLTLFNRALIREIVGAYVVCVTFDTVVSVTLSDEYSDKNDASDKWSMLMIRVILMLMVILPHLLEYIVLYITYTSNNAILEQYQRYARPNEFRRNFLECLDANRSRYQSEMIDTVKTLLATIPVLECSYALKNDIGIIREHLEAKLSDTDVEECLKLILYTVSKMDDELNERVSTSKEMREQENNLFDTIRKAHTVADTVKEILLLATLLELFLILSKHNDNNKIKQQASTYFLEYNRVSAIVRAHSYYNLDCLIYFLLQPFVKFATISKSILNELSYFIVATWAYTYQVIVGQLQRLWKITLFLVTLVLNAVVFVLIVQNLYIYSVQLAEHSIKHFQNIQLDIETTRYMGFRYLRNNQSQLYERYPGEDVSFHCISNYGFATGWRKYRIAWTHNNNSIDDLTSDRINISVTYHESYAESKLILSLIDENDFGEFRCILQEETYEYVPIIYTYLSNGYKASFLFEVIIYHRYYQMRNYDLRQLAFSENTHEIAEGTFVVFDILAYLSFAEFTDVSFLYTVNDIHVEDICTHDWLSCYPLAFIKKKFIQTETSRYSWSLAYDNLYTLTLQFCACSKIFGIHKLVMYRDYYNKTSKKVESVEIEYPVEFYFLPKGNDTGIRKELFINNTREFISRYLENNDQIVIPISPGIKLRLSVYSVFNCIAVILYIIILNYVLKGVNYITYVYCRVTIIPVRNMLLFGTFRQPLRECESTAFAKITTYRDQLYDVFISCSESDYALAQRNILPYVEDECNTKVCFPHRDLAHEAGTTLLHLYTKVTQQSKKYIVILSRSYLNDTDCNGLQLSTCILPLISEKKGDEEDLLIIKLEKNIEIPVQIKQDTRISVIDWTTTNDERHKLRKIKQWLRGFH